MLSKITNAVAVMRPRSLARVATQVDRLNKEVAEGLVRIGEGVADLRRRAKREQEALERQARTAEDTSKKIAEIAESVDSLTQSVASMQGALERVNLRAEQLTAIRRADEADERVMGDLSSILRPDPVGTHVRRALENSELHVDPFPYVVIDNLFPDNLYDAMIRAIPPRVLFEDRPVNKQQLRVPPSFAPVYARRVWNFLITDVVERMLRPALAEKFSAPLRDYLRRFWPEGALADIEASLSSSDGRIILRRAGYVIPPHRDPRWGFLTMIIYLARPGDPETWGTQLYRVNEDADAPSAQPYWITQTRCELVKDVPFRRNRAIAFLNSDGAHGASIPADAPADFERYIYQWRMGADSALMKTLLAQLTPEARVAWEGKDGY